MRPWRCSNCPPGRHRSRSAASPSARTFQLLGAVLDTPQTVKVVPQQVMQEQHATTLRDALRNVAGISMAAGEGGAQGDNLTIRGFSARNDLYIDGMRDFGSYYRDPFNLEQVEVVQGPSSATFGRGTTGGMVNQVNKVPVMSPILGGSLNFGTNGLMRLTADVDEPTKALGDGAAFRLNLMGEQTGVAGRDAAEYRRSGSRTIVAGLRIGHPDPIHGELLS